ncbi:MAG TPA: glycosyltransferase, partial [Rhodothermales bacterium]
TRQKGIVHLVNALPYLDAGVQVVLCAGAPDTPEIAREMKEAVDAARARSANPIVWIQEMLPRPDVITLYSEAALFVCPSVYEPFGIINLEAMACETPVVASAVGGIPEVVMPDETGLLIQFEVEEGAANPADPERFESDLAAAINRLMGDRELRERMGRNARRRVEEEFSWKQIAARTLGFYEEVVSGPSTA